MTARRRPTKLSGGERIVYHPADEPMPERFHVAEDDAAVAEWLCCDTTTHAAWAIKHGIDPAQVATALASDANLPLARPLSPRWPGEADTPTTGDQELMVAYQAGRAASARDLAKALRGSTAMKRRWWLR